MKKLYIILFCCAMCAPLCAYDWQASGFSPLSEGNEEESSVMLRTPEGRRITIINQQNADQESAETIRELTERFFAFEHIKIKSLTFDIRENTIRIILIPSEFTYNNTDMLDNMAAGLNFTYENQILRYNFRVKSQKMFLRINGVFIDEEMLGDKIAEALSDPQSFITRRDADYMLSRIQQLEDKIELLQAKDKKHDETDSTLMKNDRIIANNIRKVQAKSREEDEKIRYAQIAYHNNELFAGEKPIDRKIITTVLEIYRGNTSLDVDGIYRICQEREIEVSKKEIHIILVSYENVIPE
ncbi:MAG: hypothetical protein ACOCWH_07230 [Spirochaetota bacterium]